MKELVKNIISDHFFQELKLKRHGQDSSAQITQLKCNCADGLSSGKKKQHYLECIRPWRSEKKNI